MRFLFDTNTCIDLIRGRPEVVARAAAVSADDCAVSAVSVFELYSGAEKARDPLKERQRVQVLLGTLCELPFDSEAAEEAARIRRFLEAKGQPIGPFDLLLAGHALASGLTFVTNNVGEFQRVPGLPIENWRAT